MRKRPFWIFLVSTLVFCAPIGVSAAPRLIYGSLKKFDFHCTTIPRIISDVQHSEQTGTNIFDGLNQKSRSIYHIDLSRMKYCSATKCEGLEKSHRSGFVGNIVTVNDSYIVLFSENFQFDAINKYTGKYEGVSIQKPGLAIHETGVCTVKPFTGVF